MKYEFTAEEQSFRKEVKDFLSREWSDNTFTVEGSEEWWGEEKTMRKKLANQGWLALSWPREYGGAGASHMQQAIFTDEWSYAYAPGRDGEGTQSTGLLLGRRELIEAARLNNNPYSDSVGRSNKVNKEEIVGMLVALELFLERDHDAVWREWTRRCRRIERALTSIPGVSTEVFVPEIANAVPHLRIRWDYTSAGLDAEQAAERLRQGEPSIEVRPRYDDGLEIGVWMLDPGDERIVARMVRTVLGEAIRSSA